MKRIGAKEEIEIKNHPWFADMDWERLLKKEVTLHSFRLNPISYLW
jgi:hypothetical protein